MAGKKLHQIGKCKAVVRELEVGGTGRFSETRALLVKVWPVEMPK